MFGDFSRRILAPTDRVGVPHLIKGMIKGFWKLRRVKNVRSKEYQRFLPTEDFTTTMAAP